MLQGALVELSNVEQLLDLTQPILCLGGRGETERLSDAEALIDGEWHKTYAMGNRRCYLLLIESRDSAHRVQTWG